MLGRVLGESDRRPVGSVAATAAASARLAVCAAPRLVLGAVVAIVVASLGAPMLAAVAGVLVDRVVAADPSRPVPPAVGVLIAVFVTQRLAGLAFSSLMTLAQQHAGAEAAARFVDKATAIDAGYQHDPEFHDQMRHAEEIADSRFASLLSKSLTMCGALAGLIGLAAVVAAVSPAAAVLVVAALAVAAAAEQQGFAIVKRRRGELVGLRRRQAYFRSLVTHDDAALELMASSAGADIAARHRALSVELLRREVPAHRRQFAVIAAGFAAGGLLLTAAFGLALTGVLAGTGSPGEVAT